MKITMNIDEYDLLYFIESIDTIIEEAIIHGGDSGGAYYTNKEGLIKSIQQFLNRTGLDEYLIIYEDEIPKLLEKSKINLRENK